MDWAKIDWGSVADWVSGLGSLSAAIVALYLAKSAERIRLRGYCGIRIVVGQGMAPQDLVFFSVTNIGTRATVINNISMRVGWFKKRYAVITVVKDQYSVGVPYAITDGQEGHWGIPLDKDKKWLCDLASDFIKNQSDVNSLRFFVHTNHGEVLTLRPEKQLRNTISELLVTKAANSADKPERRAKLTVATTALTRKSATPTSPPSS